ncbi:hypothetical protein XENTR_v10022292 [Xenopus tropicalis]|uniref:Pentraxin family member n=1 Tax=Xenopus tropicalis TaxID=8364 RepID=B1H1E2_XENTR|nr:provisional ortholog of C-reactive protein precursor [Xenopus tropicalis]XP_031746068.1 uncharacterized protein LOC100145348 isoform X1 [Xenopus tropicalis]AAI60574.1 LOC100145348 protein [Xenopus tropicalis]KAE8588033.1 hypothetical protein XENTR_v10022292 [Xenopus tropicalis]|eukprot:NP_001120292.1 uncharacterized protein LOC100145348 precursor [Xenopus tropicalis]
MEMRVLWLFLFAGSVAQEDMDRNVFLFSTPSKTDYVVLNPEVTEPLHNLTFCLRSYTDQMNQALLTTGTPQSQKRNMFVIFQSPTDYIQTSPYFYTSIYINNTLVSIKTKAVVLDWIHRCVTWDSNTGVLQLWVNGKVFPRRVLQKGFSIDLGEGISLGQMQKDDWSPTPPFQGEISDVHMWNEVLPPETIWQVLLNNRYINGNVISWRSLNYTIIGDVTVQPKLQCRYGNEPRSLHSQCSMD